MVSIIIPAYNAEKYVERCIKSVLSQTCPLFEIIIVNDGSTDLTRDICRELCQPYKNCTILDQKNSGVSVARNKGIEYAKGDWITFLDSDDYLEADYVETIEKYSADKNVDLLLFNFATIGGEKRLQSGMDFSYTTNRLLIDGLMQSSKDNFHRASLNSPWGKAYRLERIRDVHLSFESGISMGEDMLFNLSYYITVRNFIYVDKIMYNYQYSTNSLARRFDLNITDVDRMFHKKMAITLKENHLNDRYIFQTKSFIINGYLSSLKRCLFHPDNTKSYIERSCNAKEIAVSEPYFEVLQDSDFIKHHCKVKDQILLYLAKHNRWRILDFLIKVSYQRKRKG